MTWYTQSAFNAVSGGRWVRRRDPARVRESLGQTEGLRGGLERSGRASAKDEVSGEA